MFIHRSLFLSLFSKSNHRARYRSNYTPLSTARFSIPCSFEFSPSSPHLPRISSTTPRTSRRNLWLILSRFPRRRWNTSSRRSPSPLRFPLSLPRTSRLSLALVSFAHLNLSRCFFFWCFLLILILRCWFPRSAGGDGKLLFATWYLLLCANKRQVSFRFMDHQKRHFFSLKKKRF